MSFVLARTDVAGVVTAIKAAWSAYSLKVEMDNIDSIDYATQVQPFLQVDMYYLTGEQIDMVANPSPRIEQSGQILVSAVTKEGKGSLDGLTLLDFVVPYFENKDMACIRTKAASPERPRTFRGWYYQPVLFNFCFIR